MVTSSLSHFFVPAVLNVISLFLLFFSVFPIRLAYLLKVCTLYYSYLPTINITRTKYPHLPPKGIQKHQ